MSRSFSFTIKEGVASTSRDDAPVTLTGKPVGAVVNAMKILRFLSENIDGAGVSKIARELRISPSTCFNILRTLAREDYVVFDPDRKAYAIGLGIMDLADGAVRRGGDINNVRPHFERIAREHGVTVTLWRRISPTRNMLVLAALSAGNMRIQMSVGQRLPFLLGAAGRLMAAHSDLSQKELRKQFKDIRWDRPLSFEEFMAQAVESKSRGFAVDDGNFERGVVSVAVPVFDSSGAPVMACTGTMFLGQYSAERAERLAADMAQASRTLARALPYL